MNAFETFCSDPRIVRLGLTLLHFLWQGAVAAVMLAVALRMLRKRSANVRYGVAVCSLALLAALPVMTFLWVEAPTTPVIDAPKTVGEAPGAAAFHPVPEIELRNVSPDDMPTPGMLPATDTPVAPADPVVPTVASHDLLEKAPGLGERALAVVRPWLPWMVVFWIGGVLILSIWRMGGWVQIRRLIRATRGPVSEALREKLLTMAARLGVSRPVRLLKSGLAAVPTVIGHFRPIILLPAAALTGLRSDQIEAILAHELAHIRRHDYLVNLLQIAVETLLFYHPAVWWVSRRIRDEREDCCDDLALSVCGNRATYARALATMEELRSAPRAAVAASGGSLFDRIRRILGHAEHEKGVAVGWLGIVLFVTTLVVTGMVISCGVAGTDVGADVDFVKATVTFYMDEDGNWWKGDPPQPLKITLTDKKEVAKLAAFFPKVGQGRESYRAAGWIAGLVVEFTQPNGKTVRVSVSGNDDLTVWTEGKGDWPVKGDLKTHVTMLRKLSQFKAMLSDETPVELVGISYHPSKGQPWWRPDGSPSRKLPTKMIRTCFRIGGKV